MWVLWLEIYIPSRNRLGPRWISSLSFMVRVALLAHCVISQPFTSLTAVEKRAVTVPCFKESVSKLAEDTGCLFSWTLDKTPLKLTRSPYLQREFDWYETGSILRCQVLLCSPLLTKRMEDQGYATPLPRIYNMTVLRIVSYQPSLVVKNSPIPFTTVRCPFEGSDMTITFHMNTTGPYEETGNCVWCDDSLTPAVSQLGDSCRKTTDSECFSVNPNDSREATVLAGCFGCLECTASSNVSGTTASESYQYMLRSPEVVPYENRTVIRGTELTYVCPVSDDSAESNSSTVFFYHTDLHICLQSGIAATLAVPHIRASLSGLVQCFSGSCIVGTSTINDAYQMHGQLYLTVEYPPSPVPAQTNLQTGQTIKCPFDGEPSLAVSFTMNRGPDYSCDGPCRNCNASCAKDKRGRDPAYLEAMCKSYTPCYHYTSATDESSIVIMSECYGCLQCTAVNTINNETYTDSYTWMVDTTSAPTCKNQITDLSVKVLPQSKAFVPGRDKLVITAQFEAAGQTAVLVYRNQEKYYPEDHNAIVTLPDSASCLKTWMLDFLSPGPDDGGSYEIFIGNGFGSTSFTVNISANANKTRQCEPEYCHDAGICRQLDSGEKYCECDVAKALYHGKQCQYSCPPQNDKTTAPSLSVDLECAVDTYLVCNQDVHQSDEKTINWTRNGVKLDPRGKELLLQLPHVQPTDAANYSCYLFDKLLYTIMLHVNSAPFLNDTAAALTGDTCPCNASSDSPVLFPISSFVYPAPTYQWDPVNKKDSDSVDDDRQDCISLRQQRELVLVQENRCMGLYRGKALNKYGDVSMYILANPTGPNPSTPATSSPTLLVIIGCSAFVLGVLLPLTTIIVCFRKRVYCFKINFGEQCTDDAHETAPLVQNAANPANYHGVDHVMNAARRQGHPVLVISEPEQSPTGEADDITHDVTANVTLETAGQPISQPPRPIAPHPVCGSQGSYGSLLDEGLPQAESTPLAARSLRDRPDMWVEGPGQRDFSINGESLMGDDTRMCNREVQDALKPEVLKHPHAAFLDGFHLVLLRLIAKNLENLITESRSMLSRVVLLQIQNRQIPRDQRAQTFIEFWSDADEKTFWALFQAVGKVLANNHEDFLQKFRRQAKNILGVEYFRHQQPDAMGRDMSTISQAYSHDQDTPPFMSLSSKQSQAMMSPLAAAENTGIGSRLLYSDQSNQEAILEDMHNGGSTG